ncbi:Peptidyl-prolyl cis-trans isomerase CWC27 like protein [Eufriesea mexicana]|uniref:Peptidyl-prolyl cis-trans isomerase CWC27 like protein n=1 Tax=Eufriesea mexicana TaxID=516756 RepID=A0A310SNQ1_9HYME|nr:Peptidyl-prolyl cis-trans isomerase CWC27 like protein [Eufriesea mexicana]
MKNGRGLRATRAGIAWRYGDHGTNGNFNLLSSRLTIDPFVYRIHLRSFFRSNEEEEETEGQREEKERNVTREQIKAHPRIDNAMKLLSSRVCYIELRIVISSYLIIYVIGNCHKTIDGAEVHKERKKVLMKAVRRKNVYYMESRNKKEAAYVSTEKDVWHRHANIKFIDEMENEELVIVLKGRISYKITFLSTRFNCCGRDDNDFQFYFTLGSTSELQNKHTIFGKVTGETIYNMLKLKEALVDEVNLTPLYAPKMVKAELLNNPFSDIIPRIIVQESEEVKDRKVEEDEEESAILNRKSSGKSKSAHNHLTHPKLST